ncbi:MAG: alginate export family protein [Planctomycetes bacterium]|nr:alginate export family protein [Planctomycetota bacterium]MBL7008781.1 alginate export family protein [Planctomycetota bacterium]
MTASGIESLTIDGQLRFRADQRDPISPVTGMEADSSQYARLRLGFGAQLDSNNSAYLQLQESINTVGDGQGMATMGAVHQAYGRMNNLFEMVDAQIGRFEMSYGNQRMVSPLDWSNTGRAWDGVRVARSGENYKVDLFTTQPVEGQATPIGVTNQEFHGVYFEYDWEQFELDLYGFHRRMGIGFADDTFGFLLEGDYGQLDWEIEFATQTGDHGVGLDAAGNAFALGVNYDLGGGILIGGGLEYASGRDGKDDRFVPLYHFGHAYNGHQDMVTWSNLQDLVFRSTFPINPDWSAHGDIHLLSKAEDKDAVQFGGGAAGATTAAGTDSDIGTEVDIYLKGEMADNVSIWTGVSSFTAGDAIATGDDQLWIFFQIVFGF